MKMKQFLYAISAALIVLAGIASCKKDSTAVTDSGAGSETDTIVTNTKDTVFANAVVIRYAGKTATVTNPFESSGVSVVITNGDVVVTSTVTSTEINYVLSGNTTDGSFKLYGEYKFNLVLNGVGITNTDGPAINIQCGKKVSVNVLNGTNNRLVDGSTYATSTEDQKAAFFSEGQLNFSGTGALSVTGNYKHGICSDDYIYITQGNITITKAVSDGIHANDYFKMDAGTIAVTSSGDGIDCEEGYVAVNGGTITVNSVDDGITASYDGTDAAIIPYVEIKGGVINVTTTGDKGNGIKSEGNTTVNSSDAITLKLSGKASKGFKTGGNFTLTNGNVTISTSGNAFYDTDDADIAAAAGINCDGNFIMTQGTVTITSTGTAGKGISVDGTLTVNGGAITITASGASFTYGVNTSEAKGIKSDGALTVNAGTISIAATDDAIKSEASIVFNNGTVNITKSTEGIEAPVITFNNGNITAVSSDDCVNATYGNGGEANDGSLLTFAGGSVLLSATAGDPVDGNGNVVMTGGTVIVQGPSSSPEVAIDVNGTFNISGGLLIASGPNSGNMIEATSNTSLQNTLLVKINGNVAAGTLFNIQDASGTSLVTFAPVRTAYYFVFSSSALLTGSSYKVYTGGSCTGATVTNGFYAGGTYSGGTQKGSVTVSGKLTTVSL